VRWLPHSPVLRRILLAYTANELGTWFGYVALAVGVYDHTHSAIAVTVVFIAARLIPALLGPVLVARAESSTNSHTFSELYVIEAAATGGLALLLLHFFLPGILILVTIDGTAALTANALLRAAAARAAAEEVGLPDQPGIDADAREARIEMAQRKANAALNVAWTSTIAVGPAIAGLLVAGIGASWALSLNAASFLVCALLLLRVGVHVEDGQVATVRGRLIAAWQHLRAVPRLRALLALEAVAITFFASVEPIEVIYAKVSLHAGDRGFGLLLAAWGVGMVGGSIVFARAVRRPLGPMLTGGTLAVGLSYLAFAASPNLGLACAAAVVGGVGNGVQWASLLSAVQKLTPQTLHSRLMSVAESIRALCPAIGFLLGGTITALSSPRLALLVAGIVATASTGLFLRIALQPPFSKRLSQLADGTDSQRLASGANG
jgi:MFS family permease